MEHSTPTTPNVYPNHAGYLDTFPINRWFSFHCAHQSYDVGPFIRGSPFFFQMFLLSDLSSSADLNSRTCCRMSQALRIISSTSPCGVPWPFSFGGWREKWVERRKRVQHSCWAWVELNISIYVGFVHVCPTTCNSQ